MQEKTITKAYVIHSGSFTVDPRRLAAFLGDFPILMNTYSRMELEKMVRASMPEVAAKMDPKVSIADLESLIVTADEETKYFFRQIANKRLSEAISATVEFPFRNANNKTRIKNAILAIYGQELAETGNKELGSAPTMPEANPVPEAPVDGGTPTPDATPVPGAEDKAPQQALDPKIEEDAVLTLQGYLQKYIFNSKLIPNIKIMKAFKVKNGYVLDIEFSSIDEKTKAFTKAVIHNNKLVPPAELEDDKENKIGDFTSETFLKLFSVDGGSKKETGGESSNYTDLMDQMMESPSFVQAGDIVSRISKKFGEEIARNAFDSYIRVKTKRQKNAALGAANKLDVYIGK